MSLFNANWRTQVTNLLPSFLRTTSVVDFIYCLVEPVRNKSAFFFASIDNESRKRARFNSQVIVLQSALNNIFSVTSSPFIRVETIRGAGGGFVYNQAENETKYVYNSGESNTGYVYNQGELLGTVNFRVSIPSTIYTPELERRVKNEVNIYKLAGMQGMLSSCPMR